jgi:hypothetical protein
MTKRDVQRRPGNPRSYPEHVLVRLPIGTRPRLDAVCVKGEDRSEVIRAAIEREIARRLAEKQRG